MTGPIRSMPSARVAMAAKVLLAGWAMGGGEDDAC